MMYPAGVEVALDALFTDVSTEFWDGRPGEAGSTQLCGPRDLLWNVRGTAAEIDEDVALEHLPGPGRVDWCRILSGGKTLADFPVDGPDFDEDETVYLDPSSLVVQMATVLSE